MLQNGMRQDRFVWHLYKIAETKGNSSNDFTNILQRITHKNFSSAEKLIEYIRSKGTIESTKKVLLGDIELGKALIPGLLLLADLEIVSNGDNDNLHDTSFHFYIYARDYVDRFHEAESESDKIALALIVFMVEFSRGQSWKEEAKFSEVVASFPFEKFLGKLTFVPKPRTPRKNKEKESTA